MTGHVPLFSEAFLRARWAQEYDGFRDSPAERDLVDSLGRWSERTLLGERPEHGTFTGLFFKKLWGYTASGEGPAEDGFTLWPEYPISFSGQRGGTGFADLALGFFGKPDLPDRPQVVCEFKDVRSGLDSPQRRKGNDRSPVRQAADYLREASRGLFGTEPIRPTWAIVTDMNEFRVYWRDRMPAQFQRFVISRGLAPSEHLTLLEDSERASFHRFLFTRLFHRDLLLNVAGRPALELLIRDQGLQERAIETQFYHEYRTYREAVYQALIQHNPGFSGGRARLVRTAQRFLDRCVFLLFCEDMGAALNFPQNLLRDLLIRESTDPYYAPEDTSIWHKVKRLFESMRHGTPFGHARINRFNGGLFDEDKDLDSLSLPNAIFCVRGQGADEQTLIAARATLLYFSAAYNFGIQGTGERSIGLYTLGRIFEQSVTELEFMEAEAEGRPSIAQLSKRKRDGVYYTPEWVTQLIVRHTVGRRIEELRLHAGLLEGRLFSDAELAKYQRATSGTKGTRRLRPPKAVTNYLARLDEFEKSLSQLKIVDPACGSGAFLIQAMNEMVAARRWVAEERERITLTGSLLDLDALTKEVLTQNIYGVDINPESVEITRLALWLHTALPDKPLSALDHTIRCGNSLVGTDIYSEGQTELFPPDIRERINAFDWRATFPEVFSRDDAGFDCVIGNPPYVKLQNFRQVEAEVADYLADAKTPAGDALYKSTQTGNFDMYLPFIERGLSLLNSAGRMGFIAPSVWLKNEYGRGLRTVTLRGRHLETWVDFGDYQVFEEAITYTALQFFTAAPNEKIGCVLAPNGEKQAMDVDAPHFFVASTALETDQPWYMAPPVELQLIERLRTKFRSLADVADGIAVGLQTSADRVYHLQRLGSGRYVSRASSERTEVEVEDAIMRPLVSGEHVTRYSMPASSTYLLFPYDDEGDHARLYSPAEMQSKFPRAWGYLVAHEATLRGRERGKFNDDEWYRFGRSQSLSKQRCAKLMVPRLALQLSCAADPEGSFCLDNVDVNGVLAHDSDVLWFLCAVLNAPVANLVWSRIAKPFQNGYRAANKQFIGPLPVPSVSDDDRRSIAAAARDLQKMHTDRQRKLREIERRLHDAAEAKRHPSWLWEDVRPPKELKKEAPHEARGRDRGRWAKDEYARRLALRLAGINASLRPRARLDAELEDGVLRLLIDGSEAVRAYVNQQEGPFILVQWRQVCRTTAVTEAFNASRLLDALLRLRWSRNSALRQQAIDLDVEVVQLDGRLSAAEEALHNELYDLYGLSGEERALVEREWAERPL